MSQVANTLAMLHQKQELVMILPKVFSIVFKKKDFDMSAVLSIGCNGAVTNTGWKSGVIQNIKVRCQRPLQWFICLLHFNELPYKQLYEHLDRTTTGPASFSGPTGKQIHSCEKNRVVDVLPIQSEVVITINKTDLSKDQQYLLDIVCAVITELSEFRINC